MSNSRKPIEIDSRAWTGDIPDGTEQQQLPKWLDDGDPPLPPTSPGGALGILAAHFISKKIDPNSNVLGSYDYVHRPPVKGHKTPAIRLAGPLCLAILAIGLGIWLDTDFGYFSRDYLASKPGWLGEISFSYAILAVACMVLLLATKFVTLPDWTNRVSASIGILLLGIVGVTYAWAIQAHQNAHFAGPIEPILLADSGSCGKKFSIGRGGGPPDPGPCVLNFRAMNRQGEQLRLTGHGMATERACVLVRKVSDGNGFVWYRRIAYHDLLPEMGVTDFSAAIGQSCFDGSLVKRFKPLLPKNLPSQ